MYVCKLVIYILRYIQRETALYTYKQREREGVRDTRESDT